MTDGLNSAREAIVEVGRALRERGFLAGSDGNISTRLPDGRIIITPSGKAKGELRPDQMVILRPNGDHDSGQLRASSEFKMHLFAYNSRSDVNACVHSHAPYSTAFAAAGIEPPQDLLPETVLFVGRICLTEYAAPGTEAVPAALASYISENNAFLLRNHGLLTLGRDLTEAHWRHETVEHSAKIYFLARQLCEPKNIPAEDFRRLTKMRQELAEVINKTVVD